MILSEKMQTFLTYSYFGMTDNYKNDLYTVCIERAYLDMARNIPYKYSVSKLEKGLKTEVKKTDDDIIKEVAQQFIELKDCFRKSLSSYIKDQIRLGDCVRDVIENVKRKANDEYNELFGNESFYLGLSQKWVNMSYKYLWLFDDDKVRNKSDLDIPLDSYILTAIMDDCENRFGLGIMKDELKDLKWSKIDKIDDYNQIQKKAKDKIIQKFANFETVLEWENAAWIEQAIIESNK